MKKNAPIAQLIQRKFLDQRKIFLWGAVTERGNNPLPNDHASWYNIYTTGSPGRAKCNAGRRQPCGKVRRRAGLA